MANTAQARKRARQNDQRRLHNSAQRSSMRSAVKGFLKTLQTGDVEKSRAAYQSAASAVDRAAGKGLHHPNRAARIKKKLNNRLRGLTAGAA